MWELFMFVQAEFWFMVFYWMSTDLVRMSFFLKKLKCSNYDKDKHEQFYLSDFDVISSMCTKLNESTKSEVFPKKMWHKFNRSIWKHTSLDTELSLKDLSGQQIWVNDCSIDWLFDCSPDQ